MLINIFILKRIVGHLQISFKELGLGQGPGSERLIRLAVSLIPDLHRVVLGLPFAWWLQFKALLVMSSSGSFYITSSPAPFAFLCFGEGNHAITKTPDCPIWYDVQLPNYNNAINAYWQKYPIYFLTILWCAMVHTHSKVNVEHWFKRSHFFLLDSAIALWLDRLIDIGRSIAIDL